MQPAGMGMIDPRPAVKAIICLGNPGDEYRHTRHNAGWLVGDELLRNSFPEPSPALWQPPNGLVSWLSIGGRSCVLLKPMTYMNASGEAVWALRRHFRFSLQEMLVVSDDLDLPEGRLRLRAGGSAGGHRGLASIMQCLQSADFPRLRVGIGRPEPGSGVAIVDYVLAPWVAAVGGCTTEGIVRSAAAVVREAVTVSIESASRLASGFLPGGRVNAS